MTWRMTTPLPLPQFLLLPPSVLYNKHQNPFYFITNRPPTKNLATQYSVCQYPYSDSFFFWILHIKELVTLFINIFKILFYEYMLENRSTSFMNILLIVKRVEWAIKDERINKIVKHKKWRNVYKKEVKVHHVHGWSHLLAKRL